MLIRKSLLNWIFNLLGFITINSPKLGGVGVKSNKDLILLTLLCWCSVNAEYWCVNYGNKNNHNLFDIDSLNILDIYFFIFGGNLISHTLITT